MVFHQILKFWILENRMTKRTNLYQNKYRIASARHPTWDYGAAGAYFVTVCTRGRLCWFGEVNDGEMNLSPIGELVQSEWFKTPNMRPDMNLVLGVFQVMPNHFHGIIIIGLDKTNDHDVSAGVNQFGPQSNNLASIIRGIKSSVTTKVRKMDHHAASDFAWQSRFHDHIIRDEASYQRISNYIIQNTANWNSDKFHRQ